MSLSRASTAPREDRTPGWYAYLREPLDHETRPGPRHAAAHASAPPAGRARARTRRRRPEGYPGCPATHCRSLPVRAPRDPERRGRHRAVPPPRRGARPVRSHHAVEPRRPCPKVPRQLRAVRRRRRGAPGGTPRVLGRVGGAITHRPPVEDPRHPAYSPARAVLGRPRHRRPPPEHRPLGRPERVPIRVCAGRTGGTRVSVSVPGSVTWVVTELDGWLVKRGGRGFKSRRDRHHSVVGRSGQLVG